MAAFLQKRTREAPQPQKRAEAATGEAHPGQIGDVWFVPARWLVLVLSIVDALFGRRRLSKLGIASLVWSLTPRSVKIAAGGFAAAATIVFFGAIAAIALLALQLT
jgi:hypothetical protein